MANITVSSTIDTFLKTSTLSAAQSAIDVVGLNSAGKVPNNNLYGQTYGTLIYSAETSDQYFPATLPSYCFLRNRDTDSNPSILVGTKVEYLSCYIINYNTIELASGLNTIFDLKDIYIITGNSVDDYGVYFSLPVTNFSLLTSLRVTVASGIVEAGAIPSNCRSFTFTSPDTDSGFVDQLIIQISEQTNISGGYLDLSNYAAPPTSESLTARVSLTARGWTVLTHI
jgi:hypothetical protein